jgi:lipopolysaccharide export LptBFGC system permease protein LptF
MAGVLSVFSLVRSNEHLIFKSSGVPLQRAFRPILISTVIISVCVSVLRETIMPEMIMRRDYLKPLVYHRNPAPSALALHTTDIQGHPVLFQMSQYSSTTRTGRDLRVYLLDEVVERRIPAIVADQAIWDDGVWKLRTEIHPSTGKSSLAALVPGGRSSPQVGEESEAGDSSALKNTTVDEASAVTLGSKKNPKSEKSESSKNAPPAIVPYGFKVQPTLKSVGTMTQGVPDKLPVSNDRTRLEEWHGGVTPAIIESDRLGTAVMNLRELLSAGGLKREYTIEFFRRIFEVLMALFLLWASLPLLLKEEAKHQFLGIGFSILLAAAYWGLNVSCSEAARGNLLPLWAPVIPHALFMMIGIRNFWFKMET